MSGTIPTTTLAIPGQSYSRNTNLLEIEWLLVTSVAIETIPFAAASSLVLRLRLRLTLLYALVGVPRLP